MRIKSTFLVLIFLSVISCRAQRDTALVKKNELNKEKELESNQIEIKEGSGVFLVEGKGDANSRIKVFYHRPKDFSPTSRFLIVIPGAGRNGDSYRNAWIEESEKYNFLVLSPMYPESEYEFEDYHLGGLITDSNLKSSTENIENTNTVKLDETRFKFKVNPDSNEWIFKDFDRIFDLAVAALNSKQTSYDMFGHSAGGHILHRLALFQKNSKANKILAANASFYTLPDFEIPFPFGCNNAPITQKSLKRAFKKELVFF